MSKSRNYWIKFNYKDYMLITQLLKPVQRDIFMILFCRRAIMATVNGTVNDLDLNNLRQQFFRNMRKDAWDRYLRPMIDQGLVIRSKFEDKVSYTTQLNEIVELELQQKANEKKLRKERPRPAGSLDKMSYRDKGKPKVSNKLDDIISSYKDLYKDKKKDSDTD